MLIIFGNWSQPSTFVWTMKWSRTHFQSRLHNSSSAALVPQFRTASESELLYAQLWPFSRNASCSSEIWSSSYFDLEPRLQFHSNSEAETVLEAKWSCSKLLQRARAGAIFDNFWKQSPSRSLSLRLRWPYDNWCSSGLFWIHFLHNFCIKNKIITYFWEQILYIDIKICL